MKTLFNTAVLFLLLTFIGCSHATTEVSKQTSSDNMLHLTPEQEKSTAIVAVKPRKQEISRLLRLNGKIEVPPQNILSVSVPMGGFVRDIKLLPGMHVKKGDLLAVVEDQSYVQLQQDFLTAKTQLIKAEAEYNRQSALSASQAGSDKALQAAEADYQTLKVSVGALAEKVRLMGWSPTTLTVEKISGVVRITAPFDAFVSKVNVNLGKYVNTSDILFELMNIDDVHLNLQAFERDLPELAIDQHVLAFNNSDAKNKHQGRIILISHDLSADRTVEVHCHFDQYDPALLPGMYMQAEVELKHHEAMVVKESAVLFYNNKNYVFVKKNKGVYAMTEVETGGTENGWIELVGPAAVHTSELVEQGGWTLLMLLKNTSE
jgi:cobalt-zinc-cadmium efflux system membrane fusion protein